jgi:hypothetical protein
MELKDFLVSLNSSDTHQGVWVNLRDLDNWRVGPLSQDEGWLCYLGSLEELSFGRQSREEAFYSWVSDGWISDTIDDLPSQSRVEVGGRRIHINPARIWKAYNEGRLSPNFHRQLDELIQNITSEWAELEVDKFLEQLQFWASYLG